jgi:hypothetical protein
MSGPAPYNPLGAGRHRAAGREAAREARRLRLKRPERQFTEWGSSAVIASIAAAKKTPPVRAADTDEAGHAFQ